MIVAPENNNNNNNYYAVLSPTFCHKCVKSTNHDEALTVSWCRPASLWLGSVDTVALAVFGSYPFPGSSCWEWPPASGQECRVTSLFLLFHVGARPGRQSEQDTDAMRITYSWRLVKLLAVSAVFVLSAQILSVSLGKHPSKPSPLSAEEYRLISPETYQYILNQPAVCKDSKPFLVFMVPVAPLEAAAREAVRKTWGAPSQDSLTLFFVGLPEGGQVSSIQDALEEESRKHADIIQMNFQDSYKNLTIKTMMMMNWLAVHCPNASYAMKVDSDIFVNVFYLIRRLRSSPRQGFITGSVIADGRPRREANSKWHVSEDLYPEESFPRYVSGAGYVFSADLASRISWASRFVQVIPLEDVYIGLCLRVLGVEPVYSRSLLTLRNLFEIRKLKYDRCTFAKLVIVNGFNPSELLHSWQDFSKGYRSCWQQTLLSTRAWNKVSHNEINNLRAGKKAMWHTAMGVFRLKGLGMQLLVE